MSLQLHGKDVEGTCRVDEDTAEKLSEIFALAFSPVTPAPDTLLRQIV